MNKSQVGYDKVRAGCGKLALTCSLWESEKMAEGFPFLPNGLERIDGKASVDNLNVLPRASVAIFFNRTRSSYFWCVWRYIQNARKH